MQHSQKTHKTSTTAREISQVHTLRLLHRANLALYFERLARMDDVDDRARPCRLEILQECTRVATVRIRRINALGQEVVQFLEVCVPALIVIAEIHSP